MPKDTPMSTSCISRNARPMDGSMTASITQKATLITSETFDGRTQPYLRHHLPAGMENTAETVVETDSRRPAASVP